MTKLTTFQTLTLILAHLTISLCAAAASGSHHQQYEDPQPPKGTWLGWGGGRYNNRWAKSDVSSRTINTLTQKCTFPYAPAGVSAPPLVLKTGVAYYVTYTGLLVALNYKSCTPLWQQNITTIVLDYHASVGSPAMPAASGVAPFSRTTPATNPEGSMLFIGTRMHNLVLSFRASDGKLLSKRGGLKMDPHPYAVLTSSFTFYEDTLLVGVASMEELAATSDRDYDGRFSFQGSMNGVSVDPETGELSLKWKTPMLPRLGTGSDSGSLSPLPEFTGAGVWGSQPAVDARRRQAVVCTGNSYSVARRYDECLRATGNLTVSQGDGDRLTLLRNCLPGDVYQESCVALDIATGRVRWAAQLSPFDAWNGACPNSGFSSPEPDILDSCDFFFGEDYDFGMAPAFVPGRKGKTPEDGQDMLVVGQKSGVMFGLSADTGKMFWATIVGPGGITGGMSWGVATDNEHVYYTNINSGRVEHTIEGERGDAVPQQISNSAFGAVRLVDGEIAWQVASPRNTTSQAPPTVTNDLVLVGVTGNWSATSATPVGAGSLLALDKATGRTVGEFVLDGFFAGGIAPVNDYVFLGTGYSNSFAQYPGSFQVWKMSS